MKTVLFADSAKISTVARDAGRCVISLGIEGPPPRDHPQLLRDFSSSLLRLEADLKAHRFEGDFICWNREYPKDCPNHAIAPFAFKPFCFLEAEGQGYKAALWMDASIVLKKPLGRLFEIIENTGYLFFKNSHSVGEYCKDEALDTLKITRGNSFQIPSCVGGVLGLDLSCEKSGRFLRKWKELAVDGVTFPGPKWSGVRGWPQTASQHPAVKGHRHEQTAASVLAHQLGMVEWQPYRVFKSFFAINRGSTYREFPQNPSTI